ncbi:MAG TPA: SdiA-regulated domain-containing protein [Gemmatimonadaceae bacterium]|nr:SdiA-regulated domain-containing protein [Gemmatimonadaceae bacterium]
MTVRRVLAGIAFASVAIGCRDTPAAEAAQLRAVATNRVRALERRLANADAGRAQGKPVAMWIMPTELREISGIALTARGQLLAHGDERALVYVLDPRTGIVVDRFHVGEGTHADFEGITVAGDDLWMIQSNGKLYQFKRGTNNSRVAYKIHDTHLGKECEFEGVAFDPDSAWLVMPCKRALKKAMRGQFVMYHMRLAGADSGKISEFTIPMETVVGSNKWKNFRPSDITLDPNTGNYVMVAAQEKGLVVMTPEGDVLRSEHIPGKHPQAEGVAITIDNILIISDEASNGPASITLYRWRP